jgi:hypothetical protein
MLTVTGVKRESARHLFLVHPLVAVALVGGSFFLVEPQSNLLLCRVRAVAAVNDCKDTVSHSAWL